MILDDPQQPFLSWGWMSSSKISFQIQIFWRCQYFVLKTFGLYIFLPRINVTPMFRRPKVKKNSLFFDKLLGFRAMYICDIKWSSFKTLDETSSFDLKNIWKMKISHRILTDLKISVSRQSFRIVKKHFTVNWLEFYIFHIKISAHQWVKNIFFRSIILSSISLFAKKNHRRDLHEVWI